MSVIHIPTIRSAKINLKGAGRGANASGYGSKITTRYMIRFNREEIWRRVYCIQWSNAGSFYIISCGKRMFINDMAIMEHLNKNE